MSMELLGELLSLPVRLVNAPIRAVENLCNGGDDVPEADRLLSKPLDMLADAIEKATED